MPQRCIWAGLEVAVNNFVETNGWSLVTLDGAPVTLMRSVSSSNGMCGFLTGGRCPSSDADAGDVFTTVGVHRPEVWGLKWVATLSSDAT